MTKPDWCSEWAWSRGLEIANDRETLGVTIARALLEAERRGMERAAKIAHCHSDDRPRRYGMDWNDGYMDGCRGASDAIRAAAKEIEP